MVPSQETFAFSSTKISWSAQTSNTRISSVLRLRKNSTSIQLLFSFGVTKLAIRTIPPKSWKARLSLRKNAQTTPPRIKTRHSQTAEAITLNAMIATNMLTLTAQFSKPPAEKHLSVSSNLPRLLILWIKSFQDQMDLTNLFSMNLKH